MPVNLWTQSLHGRTCHDPARHTRSFSAGGMHLRNCACLFSNAGSLILSTELIVLQSHGALLFNPAVHDFFRRFNRLMTRGHIVIHTHQQSDSPRERFRAQIIIAIFLIGLLTALAVWIFQAFR